MAPVELVGTAAAGDGPGRPGRRRARPARRRRRSAGVAHHRHHQRLVVEVDGDAEVHLGVHDQAVVADRRVDVGELGDGVDDGAGHEREVASARRRAGPGRRRRSRPRWSRGRGRPSPATATCATAVLRRALLKATTSSSGPGSLTGPATRGPGAASAPLPAADRWAAAASTSARVTRPSRPEPTTWSTPSPCSSSSRRTTGVSTADPPRRAVRSRGPAVLCSVSRTTFLRSLR